MKEQLKKITSWTREKYNQRYTRFKKLSKLSQTLCALVALAFLGAVSLFFFRGNDVVKKETVVKPQVRVASILTLSNTERDFPLIGNVTSVSEATIRSEASGRLTRVYKKLGDIVYAGGVIAEFENSAERASLLQAEGSYDQAKAVRTIAGLNSGQAGTSLSDTKAQAVNTIISSYVTLDDAVRGKTDSSFLYPKFEQVKLLLSIPDATLATTLESKRRSIEKILISREIKNRSISENSDILAELNSLLSDAQTVKAYLDDLYTAYSKGLSDSNFSLAAIDSGKASVQAARQAVSSTISSLVTTKAALSASLTASQVAGSGSQESSGTLASADAQVKQALGAYNAASSRLEKTIIRSPITGTLNSLTISTGDYIGSFTQVAIVSNNGALEVISLVTEDDTKRITVGSSVMINETIPGVITRIAQAIDPTTKKIEVRIGIKDAKTTLINGQSVSITILKNKTTVVKNTNAPIVIPLSALKLTPYGANVFTVSATGTLIALPVTEGAILGEQIQILQGLKGDEVIVVDARGLKEGTAVDLILQ